MVNLDTAKVALCDSAEKTPGSWHTSVVEDCLHEIKGRFRTYNMTDHEAYQKLQSITTFSYWWIPQFNGYDCGVFILMVSEIVYIFVRLHMYVYFYCVVC